jgi:hypothetical protein
VLDIMTPNLLKQCMNVPHSVKITGFTNDHRFLNKFNE